MPKIPSGSYFYQTPIVIFLLVSALAFPQVVSAESPLTDFIPLEEIKSGMTGYGLTVFQGSTIDTFSVTVIGIQKNNRVAGSMLLVEVGGHGLELSAIAQGMSGSPIFIGGRLAGALAFGWAGALRPIAGVTPAAEILALPGSLPTRQHTTAGQMSLHDLLPHYAHVLARDLSLDAGTGLPSGSGADPIAQFQENWPSAETLAREMLENLGVLTGTAGGSLLIQPVGTQPMGGIAGAAHKSDATLQPGSACGIPLVMGDAQLGATGTVTWVQGDRIFMFGHPFMQRGPVEYPLSTAEVLTVFPSRQMSFKMASMGQPVGSIHHDQRAGIAGRLGPVPDMIPVRVEIVSPGEAGEEKFTQSYSFQVADDPMLSPTLVFWSLYNSLLARGDDASLQTLHYNITTTWEGDGVVADEPLVLSGIAAGPGSVQALASAWMAPLSMLLNNSFQPVKLVSVDARFTMSRPMGSAEIIGLSGPRVVTATGETVVFKAEIEPRLGESEFIDFAFQLPANLPPGPYRVVVTSAAELFSLDPLRAPGSFDVTTLGQVMDVLRTPRAQDTLVLAILAPGKSVVLQGREMKSLPSRVNKLLKKGNMQAQPTLADYVLRVENNVPWAIQGHAVRVMELINDEQSLKVERRP